MSYKRIQKKGWSVGENTKTRKTSINLDTDIANVIEEKKGNQRGSSLERL